ncbi:hypothetical protein S83_044861 [Arachis hypogaea]
MRRIQALSRIRERMLIIVTSSANELLPYGSVIALLSRFVIANLIYFFTRLTGIYQLTKHEVSLPSFLSLAFLTYEYWTLALLQF